MPEERYRIHGHEYSGAGLPPLAAWTWEWSARNEVAEPAPVRPTVWWPGPPDTAAESRFWRGVGYGAIGGLALWTLALVALWAVLRWL